MPEPTKTAYQLECERTSAIESAAMERAGRLHDEIHEASALVNLEGSIVGWAPEDSIPILARALVDFTNTQTERLSAENAALKKTDAENFIWIELVSELWVAFFGNEKPVVGTPEEKEHLAALIQQVVGDLQAKNAAKDEVLAKIHASLEKCDRDDPCDYDHVCRVHLIRGDLSTIPDSVAHGKELIGQAARIEAQAAEIVRLREALMGLKGERK